VSLLQWHSSSKWWSAHRSIYQWIDLSRVSVQIVSLLQWHSSSMRWSIYSHRSTYQWIDLPHVSVQIVSLLQRHDSNRSLRWASRLVSLLQWRSSSKRWSVHRSTYQWTSLPSVNVQLVSLLQWQAESWYLRWASRLVSLLQWHSSSMRWSIYSHRSTYQWTGLPHVHVQLVSLLQWSFYLT